MSSGQVLTRASLPTMYTLLRQRRLRWIGHVRRMEDGHIPKDILYGELASGERSVGYPQLRYKDVCKRDMKVLEINAKSWEDIAADRSRWRSVLQRQLKTGEEKIKNLAEKKRARRKARTYEDNQATTHTRAQCNAAEIAIPDSVLSVTADVVAIMSSPRHQTTKAHHPWSISTDGGLLLLLYPRHLFLPFSMTNLEIRGVNLGHEKPRDSQGLEITEYRDNQ